MNKKPTLLIVDDTTTNIDILVELLHNEYEIVVSTTGKGALIILENENIDLILLDIMMPELDGYDVCKMLKSNTNTQCIPIIFITAKCDEDSIEKAYDTGGVDYVTKPFKPKELMAKIRTHIQLKSTLEHLKFISSHDSMTGIYNRRKFFELGLSMFEQYNDLFAIIIDIDNFKTVNDQYGHPIGDKVIKNIVTNISSLLPSDSIFARLGGEEFAVLIPSSQNNQIENLINDIRAYIETSPIVIDNNTTINCTISSGIAQKNANIKTLDKLLKIADDGLYEAKHQGRNKTIFRC